MKYAIRLILILVSSFPLTGSFALASAINCEISASNTSVLNFTYAGQAIIKNFYANQTPYLLIVGDSKVDKNAKPGSPFLILNAGDAGTIGAENVSVMSFVLNDGFYATLKPGNTDEVTIKCSVPQ